ncbi:MAG: hypothetical protein EOO88_62335 [Pedobacter sp.]|nr:MAG: hypothetical protein EOO88_62335 [Pedobacter sp.]
MSYTEHKIVIGESGLEIILREINEATGEFTVESDSGEFYEIFGTNSFTFIRGNSSVENSILISCDCIELKFNNEPT